MSVMSNSVRPHRQQPTRLLHPWDSPGKNTGVGCHFLLQCMKVKSESEVTQSSPTLSNPMDCSLPGSSVHGIPQARVLEWVTISFIHMYIKLYINMYKAGIEEAAYSSSLLCSLLLPYLLSIYSLSIYASILSLSTKVFIFYASSISYQIFSFYEALNPLTHTIDIS